MFAFGNLEKKTFMFVPEIITNKWMAGWLKS